MYDMNYKQQERHNITKNKQKHEAGRKENVVCHK